MKKYFGIILSFIAGMLVMGIAVWTLMPSMMLATHESRYASVDETTTALQEAIVAQGWFSPGVRNMNKAMAADGVTFDKQVRIVELCKAAYAKEVLSTNPEVSTMMPCSWGVYEKDGKVYITGMNMGLMGKMFGGNISKVIGGKVAGDEEAILSKVICK